MAILFDNDTSFELNTDRVEAVEKVMEEIINYFGCPYPIEVSITFVDNNEIRELNKEYKDKDQVTDVLSFPQIDFEKAGDFDFLSTQVRDECFNLDNGELMLGDIVISATRLEEQAEEYKHTILRELCFLITHSMLHLLGYDHMEKDEEEEMFLIQEEILNKVGITR